MPRRAALLLLVIGALSATAPAASATTLCYPDFVTLVGTEGDDVLIGTDGDDVIAALGGDDVILGMEGNDYICPGTGSDVADGGFGRDLVSYVDLPARGIEADLTAGRVVEEQVPTVHPQVRRGTVVDRIAGFEDFAATPWDDTILGSPQRDSILAGAGNDRVIGGDGADRIDGGPGADDLMAGDGILAFTGRGRDYLQGGDGNDVLTAASGGSSTLAGGPGDDLLMTQNGEHSFWGEDGIDTVSYMLAPNGVRIDLSLSARQLTGFGLHDFRSVENASGSYYYGDFLRGNLGDNRLWGWGGNDVLDGAGGNDALDGGDGDDTCINGASVACEA